MAPQFRLVLALQSSKLGLTNLRGQKQIVGGRPRPVGATKGRTEGRQAAPAPLTPDRNQKRHLPQKRRQETRSAETSKKSRNQKKDPFWI